MTIAPSRPGVADVITDIAKSDEGTALLVAEMLTYEALCEEVDRIRPFLERDAARVIEKRAEGALEALAKRWHGASETERAELAETAEGLAQLVAFSKEGGDDEAGTGDQRWWNTEPRDQRGRWTKGLVDALRLFAGHKDTKGNAVSDEASAQMNAIASGGRYARARTLGQGLDALGRKTGNQNLSVAGHVTRLVGEVGQEAEGVFGRGLTRLAYRYRGTERRPNEGYRSVIQAHLTKLKQDGKLTEQSQLRTVSDLGAGFLWPSVPDQHLAELSLAAGRMPPSQGIIFDAQGNPVSQAVGFNGDHYLPFDLKNLKRLQGGSYVRTRTTGGLTDEDIYTGLLTGARQVTVISNSGVFSIEFDPQLRGGRRYSDKARQMVDRYSQLLATINSKNAPLAQDLSPKEKAKIRTDAYHRAQGNRVLAEQFADEELKKEQFKRKFSYKDDTELMDEALDEAKSRLKQQQAAGQVRGASTRTISQLQREIFNEKKAAERKNAVREYRLDGEGYKAAQDALAQEFPYYIRTKTYEPLDRFLQRREIRGVNEPLPPRPAKDIGYTRRNALSPGETARTTERQTDTTKPPTEQKVGFGSDGSQAAPKEAAAAWAAPLTQPNSPLRDRLANELERSLEVRNLIDDPHWQLPPTTETDNTAYQLPWDQWAAWVLDTKRTPDGVAAFLMDPRTDSRHLDKAILALQRLKNNTRSDFKPADFDSAVSTLEQIQRIRQPFAAKADDMVMAAPSRDHPAPQPFPEIYGLVSNLGPDSQALRNYASKNLDIAEQAQKALDSPDGEARLVAEIRDEVSHLNGLANWPREADNTFKENHTPSDQRLNYDDARLYEQDPQDFGVYQDLEKHQKAWALASAAKFAHTVEGSAGVPQLVPKEEVAQRAPQPRRIALSKNNSPSFSGVQRRSVTGRRVAKTDQSLPSSPSPLALELAKRLTDDPQYLQKYLS